MNSFPIFFAATGFRIPRTLKNIRKLKSRPSIGRKHGRGKKGTRAVGRRLVWQKCGEQRQQNLLEWHAVNVMLNADTSQAQAPPTALWGLGERGEKAGDNRRRDEL